MSKIYAAAWLGTTAAIVTGVIVTGRAWCIWALLIPFLYSLVGKNEEEKTNGHCNEDQKNGENYRKI